MEANFPSDIPAKTSILVKFKVKINETIISSFLSSTTKLKGLLLGKGILDMCDFITFLGEIVHVTACLFMHYEYYCFGIVNSYNKICSNEPMFVCPDPFELIGELLNGDSSVSRPGIYINRPSILEELKKKCSDNSCFSNSECPGIDINNLRSSNSLGSSLKNFIDLRQFTEIPYNGIYAPGLNIKNILLNLGNDTNALTVYLFMAPNPDQWFLTLDRKIIKNFLSLVEYFI